MTVIGVVLANEESVAESALDMLMPPSTVPVKSVTANVSRIISTKQDAASGMHPLIQMYMIATITPTMRCPCTDKSVPPISRITATPSAREIIKFIKSLVLFCIFCI